MRYPSLPIRVISVSGTDAEIGAQHGHLLESSLKQGMVKFYHRFWQDLSGEPPKGAVRKSIRLAAHQFLHRILIPRLIRSVPASFLERIEAMAKAVGESPEEHFVSLVLPDIFPLLQTRLENFRPEWFGLPTFPTFGCSSFLHLGKRFLHGRNLDFPGVAYWDRYPVLQLTQHKRGLRYVALTTAGVPLGGITGVNEAQISVALHQHYCRYGKFKGLLPFVIGEQILTEASNLQQAKDILLRSSVASAWAFIVTDGKTREAFICETHPYAKGFRTLSESHPLLVQTNYFQSEECRGSGYSAGARMSWDNYARKQRLEQVVRQAGYSLTERQSTAALSDHVDLYWGEEKVFNRTVSQVYNIQSVLFDTEAMQLWMAEGDSPVHLRNYVKFDLGAIFAGREGRTGDSLPPFAWKDLSKREAKEEYILSFVAEMDGKRDLAQEGLRRSLSHSFTPEAALTLSVIHLKFGAYDEAVQLLERAKTEIENRAEQLGKLRLPPEYFEILLTLARSHDLSGANGKGSALRRSLASHRLLEDSHLRRLAAGEGIYTKKNLDKIFTPYSSYIPFM